jgi:2-methylfumaryl-CoA isomerase
MQPGLGRFPVPGHSADFSEIDREPPRAAPILGANTEEVLSEVTGLDDTEIARLFDEGIVRGAYSAETSAA